MKDVLIIELGGSHMENIYSVIELMNIKKCPVHFIGNKKLVPLLPEPEKMAGITGLANEFSFFEQIKAFLFIRKYIKKHRVQAVIIGTTEITIIRNLSFFLPQLNYTGIVHNAKKLEDSYTFSKILSKKIRKFLVFGNYLLSELKPDPVFSICPLYAVHFPKPKRIKCTKPAGDFWVIIPGEVLADRREYTALLQAMIKMPILPQIKIIFLGCLKNSPEITGLVNENLRQQNSIITFEEYLDYDSFHSYMPHADFILPLLKFDNSDFYSNKRISGSFNLGLGYKTPFLLSSNYRQNNDLAPFSMYYDTMEELITTINKVAGDPAETEKIKVSYTQCNYCSIAAQADTLFNFIIS